MSIAVVVVGAALGLWGARSAGSRQRPLDLVGSLAAGVGVLVLGAGLTALVVRGFFE